MNLDQIVRLGLFQADQVKQSGTASSFVSNAELFTWANDGNRRIEAAVRRLKEDYFVRRMNSADDTSAQRITGISYTPSTSLRIAADTIRFTLPPDYQTLRSIRCVTSGYETIRFLPRDVSHGDFQNEVKRATTETVSPGGDMLFATTGERTLWVVPMLSSSIDIEINYVARTHLLVRYATGTVAVTDATDDVVGTGTTWTTLTPFDANFLDIMFGTSGSATVPTPDPTWDYDQVYLAKVLSLDTDTTLTLAANKIGTLAAGTGYILSSVPQLPAEYHYGIADYVSYRILKKRNNPAMAGYKESFFGIISELESLAPSRQQAEPEYVEAYIAGESG